MTITDVLTELSFLDDAHVVGGAVRDMVIGREAGDIDVACRTRPDEVMALAEERGIPAHPTGIDHGTVTLVLGGEPIEVTTFRRDVATDGRRAVIAFANTMEEDLARRDFTVNAMALRWDGGIAFGNLRSGPEPGSNPLEIVDPFEGMLDCQRGVIRTVGEPMDRFLEDLLRPIRALRFAARFDFRIGRRTERAMREVSQDVLRKVSEERVLWEMRKALKQCEDPERFLWSMDGMGWLSPLFEGGGHGQMESAWRLQTAADRCRYFAPDDRFAFCCGMLERTDALDRLPVSTDERRQARALAQAVTEMGQIPTDTDESSARLFQRRNKAVLPALNRAEDPAHGNPSLLRDTGVPIEPVLTGQDLLDEGMEPGPAIGEALEAAHDTQLGAGIVDRDFLVRHARSAYESHINRPRREQT